MMSTGNTAGTEGPWRTDNRGSINLNFRTSRGTLCDFKHRRNTVVSDIFKKSGLSQKFIDMMLDAYSPPVDQCRLRGAEGVAYNVHFCFDHEVRKF